MAENKTNAMRMLDRAKVPYTPHTYETDGEHVDGITVATSIGEPLERVYKTLVTAGKSGGHYVFCHSGWQRSWISKRPQRLSEKNPCR